MFGLAKDPLQRGMARDTAVVLWRLLLADRFPLTADWTEFIEKHWDKGKQA